MELHISESYEAMSEQAAAMLFEELTSLEKPLLCPASGDSPAEMYRQLTQLIRQKNTNISQWNFVGLDEWLGMNGSDEGSCRFHLNHQLFGPLNVDEKNICFFDGRALDLLAECDRTDRFIKTNGGIDLAVVGLGLNGHVGMNEPGTSPFVVFACCRY